MRPPPVAPWSLPGLVHDGRGDDDGQDGEGDDLVCDRLESKDSSVAGRLDSWRPADFELHVRRELESINTKIDVLIEQSKRTPKNRLVPLRGDKRHLSETTPVSSPARQKTTENMQKSFTRSQTAKSIKSMDPSVKSTDPSVKSADMGPSVVSGLEMVLGAAPSTVMRQSSSVSLRRTASNVALEGLRRNGSSAMESLKRSSTSLDPVAVLTADSLERSRSNLRSPTISESLHTAVVPEPSGAGAGTLTIGASKMSLSPQLGSFAECGDSPVGASGSMRSRRSSDPDEKDLQRAENLLTIRHRRTIHYSLQLAHDFMDDPESSIAARVHAHLTPVLLLATVGMTLSQSLKNPPLDGVPMAVLETTVDSLFLFECIVRFFCWPTPWAFLFDVYNIIDLLAAVPLAIRAAIGFVIPSGEVASVPHAILLCCVPIIRLLKTLRRFEKFHLILNAFRLAAEALPVLLFILSIIALTFAMLIYLVEPRDNVESIPMSLWLTIVTMSTVGYGDMAPTTTVGHLVTSVLIVISALYMSIPLGIVGQAFAATWEQRDKILLMQRTRDRLRQWGFTASDIPALFHLSAGGESGSLDIKDFRKLLNRMQIGFSEERILKLFESFDEDNSGSVDDREFVRHLFPHAYHAIYGVEDEESEEADKVPSDGEAEGGGSN